MGSIDLDALRAARSEGRSEAHVVTFGGETFFFRAEMPLQFAELLQEAKLTDAVRVLLSDERDLGRFLALGPSVQDVAALAGLYGVGGLGESSASIPPSENTSNGWRPTFNGSTDSTSAPSASALKP